MKTNNALSDEPESEKWRSNMGRDSLVSFTVLIPPSFLLLIFAIPSVKHSITIVAIMIVLLWYSGLCWTWARKPYHYKLERRLKENKVLLDKILKKLEDL